jgi:hypothetical protein
MKNIMNFAKLFSLLLICMAFINSNTYAQKAGQGKGSSTPGAPETTVPTNTPAEKKVKGDSSQTDKMAYRLKERLSLTDAQTEKVKAIYATMKEQAKKDRETYKDNKEGMKQANKARREKADAEIKALLDKTQLEKYEAYKKEMKEARKNKKGQGQGKGKGKGHEKGKGKGHEKHGDK